MRAILVSVIAAPLVVSSCGGDRRSSGIPHPDARNAPPATAATITSEALPIGMTAADLSAWVAARDNLLEATPVLRLGSERRGPELFGYVPKADIAPDGSIVVLDELAQEVRIFDSDGGFVDMFGGMGEGPLELRNAVDFHLFPDGRIAVPLGRFGPVKVFGRSNGRWTLLSQRETRANDLCGMSDGSWFSAGYKREDDTIINRYEDSADGAEDVSHSFGSGYIHDQSFIRSALSNGLIGCIDQANGIVFGFSVLPIVRSYSTEGGLNWTAALDAQYLQLRVWERRHPESGRVGYSEDTRQPYDRLAQLEQVGGDHVLLQYARTLPSERRIVARSYLISASTLLRPEPRSGRP